MAINVVGGLIIGSLQKGLSISEAAQTYTLLTIGDGLVSQIPALIVSTSAGIIISRAAAEASMGRDFAKQFAMRPEALALAAVIVFIFGLMPGLPTVPFTVLALFMGGLAYLAYRTQKALALPEEEEAAAEPEESATPEAVEELLMVDILELEVGYALIPLVDESQGGDLLERIRTLRRQFAMEMGLIVPPLHVRDNLQLRPGEYVILIKGVEVARAELMPGHYLAMDPGDVKKKIEGIPTTEPAFGLPALWVPEEKREEAELAGYTVVDLSTVLITHLAEVIKAHADELLGRQEVQRLLDALAKHYPKAVEECLNVVPLGVVQKVLHNLVRERVSIRDLLTIVEAIADYGQNVKDPDLLTEYVRQRLARVIVRPYLDQEGKLHAVAVGEDIEEAVRRALQRTDQGTFLTIDPKVGSRIVAALTQAAERLSALGYHPVFLSSPVSRRHLRRLIERSLPQAAVISQAEIPPQVTVEIHETVRLT